ncbi:hypothetical protein Ade02nite_74610 [Paractinoplanes deccanensis]|uniref:Uncharacterized protein n=1 Tax=Paractinoplanes deccanensis TaxID=113561 RepID=A0ABQ3YFY7_9ACTN|nr:hypothetical protein Ade02nite_74610 [Actinoplanes deccanensis]
MCRRLEVSPEGGGLLDGTCRAEAAVGGRPDESGGTESDLVRPGGRVATARRPIAVRRSVRWSRKDG